MCNLGVVGGPETGAAEESGGGGYWKWTCIPESDTSGVSGAKPEHRTSGEYGLLALEAPAGDHFDRARVVGGDGTTELPVDTEVMETEEEACQRAQTAGGVGGAYQKRALTARIQQDTDGVGPERQLKPLVRG